MSFFKLKFFVAILGIMIIPKLVSAATVSLTSENQQIAVGDTAIIDVVVNTGDQKPNVIEGDILIKTGVDKITDINFSQANSVLTLWPKNPSLDKASLISFIGGRPGGFSHDSGLLFKIIFKAQVEGEVVFLPSAIKAYNNDAKATPINVSNNPLIININKSAGAPQDAWLEVIAKDNQPPVNLTANVGQDSSTFDGKKFLAISAQDTQSGIDHYEVVEGSRQAVRSGDTYVLLDQKLESKIIVIAYDKAGNFSQLALKPAGQATSYWRLIAVWVVVLAVVGLLIFIVIKLIKKYKKIKKKNA